MKRKIEVQLLALKNNGADRMPLIVNGARQVGKTYVLRQFGEENFKNVVYVNGFYPAYYANRKRYETEKYKIMKR